MILIVASRHDASAPLLAATWRKASARVVTCDDLTAGGWSWTPGRAGRARLRVRGRSLAASDVRGVLVRLPQVTEGELPEIDPEDRDYVAVELTAFLSAFLIELPCRVVNRPTPTRLDGPAWSPERWRREAQRLGLPTVTSWPDSTAPSARPGGTPKKHHDVTTSWIDGRCHGTNDDDVQHASTSLARAAGVDLVGFIFRVTASGPVFVDANLGPPLDTSAKRAAVLQMFHPATAR